MHRARILSCWTAADRKYAAAVRVAQHGGPEVLSYEEYDLSAKRRPAGREVLLRHSFAGVNFIDTYYRTGLYKDESKPMPFIVGTEGTASVLAVGPDADPALLGRRVAFFRAMEGAYTAFSMAKADDLFVVPKGIKDDVAAASLLQGCTAHYLANDCFDAKEGSTVVVHAAAGGTGLLLSQMCVAKGATVIGICGGADKAGLAKSVGKATHVIDYKAEMDWPSAVRRIAPTGVNAVYDGVGKSTFDGSMSVLAPRGAMISFGNASGPVPPVSPLDLTKRGSVSLQRPSLFHYMDRESGEAQRRVDAVFGAVAAGELQVRIGARFMLRDARKAHEALESQATTGKIVLDCTE